MKVLLAIDSSEGSDDAITAVTVRPWPESTTSHVLSVVEDEPVVTTPAPLQTATEAAQKLVKNAAARLTLSGIDTSTAVIQGDARSSIVEYAERWGADLIVVGSHGHGAVARLLLGSVAQAVIRHAPCSVEVVRGHKVHKHGPTDAMRILIATDGSECSTVAVHSFAKRPWPKGSEVKIISAADIIALAIEPWYGGAATSSRLQEEIMKQASRAVAEARDILSSTGLSVTETIPITNPHMAILDEAKSWGADLIVVGSHGWRGLNRLLLGSVAEVVAVRSPCSVEVIREGGSALT